jgi:putative ABC transport system substrate-binding protein
VIDRRVFIGAAASALITIPFAAPAQQKDKVRHIGILAHGEPPTLAENQETWAPARELGWIEGRNLIVEGRYAKGQAELLRPFAEELVRLNVEIIVTQGTDATLAAKNATSSIPIVFISVGDPVAAGLVASLARPGGNITGLSLGAQGVDAKRLSLLRELLPDVQRVGDLENPNNPFFRLARNFQEQAYRSLGIQRILIEVATASELENAVAEVARRGGQALVVPSDGLFESNRITIMRAALHHALPTFVEGRNYLEAGALLSYARSGTEAVRQFLTLIDKILRGAKPADLPVQEPTRFELLINLKTAKALHITIPQSVLLRVDDVIR